jgi:CHAT domain-containing protein
LLAPAAAFLNESKLMIVSDGALHYLPFAALHLPGSSRPLGLARQVARLPSASTLASLHRPGRKTTWSRTLAVLADPVFDSGDPRAVRTLSRASLRSVSTVTAGVPALSRLAYTRREAEAVGSLVPPRQVVRYIGFDAAKHTLSVPELKDVRILHLATHATIDDERPLLSAIEFSHLDREGRAIDGTLRLFEVFGLDLPVELAIVGACRTGLGRQLGGEGIIGFTRAFLYAGAANVLVSLWAIDDEATAEFMVHFYRHLLGNPGSTPAAALRFAREQMGGSARWSDPYYWAGFILHGALS